MSAAVVKLPARFVGETMMELSTHCLDTRVDGVWPEKLTFDFETLQFIRPAGLVFLNNMVKWLNLCGCEILFKNHTVNRNCLNYLDDAQLFQMRLGQSNRADARSRSTTFQLEEISSSASSAQLSEHFVPWIASTFNASSSANALLELRTSLKELFNNISDHTQFDIGSISAQHFPADNEIEIALADFGSGIPNSVRKIVSEEISDSAAIEKAFEEGFTTKSVPNNMGAGLALLRDNCVGVHRGTLVVYSGHGIITFRNRDGTITCDHQNSNKFCPGTVFVLTVKKDRMDLTQSNETDLDWDL